MDTEGRNPQGSKDLPGEGERAAKASAGRYIAAEASLKDSQQKSHESRQRMTQLLSQVEDDQLRQDLMHEFHEYAAHMQIRAKCNEMLKRDGHS